MCVRGFLKMLLSRVAPCSAIVVATLLVVSPGCGSGDRPEIPTVDVSGVVMMDGKPLADAQINLLTAEYAGSAMTDASGNFKTRAQAGENKVYIVKYEGLPPGWDATMTTPSDTPGGGPKMKIPSRFSDPTKTELKFNVPDSGSTDAKFEITSK
jgi:hypothetical protein